MSWPDLNRRQGRIDKKNKKCTHVQTFFLCMFVSSISNQSVVFLLENGGFANRQSRILSTVWCLLNGRFPTVRESNRKCFLNMLCVAANTE